MAGRADDASEKMHETRGWAMESTSWWIQAALAGEFGRTVDVGAGHVLVEEGCPGDEAYVLVSGNAEVVVGGRRVAWIGPGELFGEMAVLDRKPRSATVTATEPSRVAVLDRRMTDGL